LSTKYAYLPLDDGAIAWPGVVVRPRLRSRPLLEFFVGAEILCQLALLTPALAGLRLVWRTAPFALSLALLALLPGRGRLHPAAKAALCIFVILALALLNPAGDTLTARIAQIAMYAAILAPLFWVSRLRIDRAVMRRVLLIVWGFNTLSAVMGVLQGYYPGRFQPNVSAVILAGGPFVEGLKYRNGAGALVFRPMGLSDVPGGAAGAGLYAAVLGMALFVGERRLWKQALFAASMLLGTAAIYLCLVRSTLVMLLLSMLVFALVIALHNLKTMTARYRSARRRARIRLAPLIAAIAAASLIGFSTAVSIGGRSVVERFITLAPGNARQTFHQSRGHFLEETLQTLLPEFPLGAGLGRWGMMNYYFGDKSDPEEPLWAEIQWTAWLYDGGILLILAYTAAIALALGVAYRIALDPAYGEVAVWGAMMVAYGVSVLALTFDYAFFQSQGGMDFWLLNAMLFTVVAKDRHPAPVAVPYR
jgi:hypothetical protein